MTETTPICINCQSNLPDYRGALYNGHPLCQACWKRLEKLAEKKLTESGAPGSKFNVDYESDHEAQDQLKHENSYQEFGGRGHRLRESSRSCTNTSSSARSNSENLSSRNRKQNRTQQRRNDDRRLYHNMGQKPQQQHPDSNRQFYKHDDPSQQQFQQNFDKTRRKQNQIPNNWNSDETVNEKQRLQEDWNRRNLLLSDEMDPKKTKELLETSAKFLGIGACTFVIGKVIFGGKRKSSKFKPPKTITKSSSSSSSSDSSGFFHRLFGSIFSSSGTKVNTKSKNNTGSNKTITTSNNYQEDENYQGSDDDENDIDQQIKKASEEGQNNDTIDSDDSEDNDNFYVDEDGNKIEIYGGKKKWKGVDTSGREYGRNLPKEDDYYPPGYDPINLRVSDNDVVNDDETDSNLDDQENINTTLDHHTSSSKSNKSNSNSIFSQLTGGFFNHGTKFGKFNNNTVNNVTHSAADSIATLAAGTAKLGAGVVGGIASGVDLLMHPWDVPDWVEDLGEEVGDVMGQMRLR